MKRVIVSASARLHITLLDLHGGLGRVDGSVGVAVSRPQLTLSATLTGRDGVEAKAPSRLRSLIRSLAGRLADAYGLKLGCRLEVKRHIPLHVGLGSVTQTALALATALAKLYGLNPTPRELAAVMGRGGTSGVGVAAFEGGGFVLDAGHTFGSGREKASFLPSEASKAPPPTLLVRYALPEDWFFVVAIPRAGRAFYGEREAEVFRRFCPVRAGEVERLCRLVLMRLLPAAARGEIEELGAAIDAVQGLGFKKVEVSLQSSTVRLTMAKMKATGAYGAGLSSFGPAVYGLYRGLESAERAKRALRKFLIRQGGGVVFTSRVKNEGARVELEE